MYMIYVYCYSLEKHERRRKVKNTFRKECNISCSHFTDVRKLKIRYKWAIISLYLKSCNREVQCHSVT